MMGWGRPEEWAETTWKRIVRVGTKFQPEGR